MVLYCSTTMVHGTPKTIVRYHVDVYYKACRSNPESLRLEKCLAQMLAAWRVIGSKSGAPITTVFFLCLGATTTLEEDGSGNWGTIFLSNYFSNCQHLGKAFFFSRRLFIFDSCMVQRTLIVTRPLQKYLPGYITIYRSAWDSNPSLGKTPALNTVM